VVAGRDIPRGRLPPVFKKTAGVLYYVQIETVGRKKPKGSDSSKGGDSPAKKRCAYANIWERQLPGKKFRPLEEPSEKEIRVLTEAVGGGNWEPAGGGKGVTSIQFTSQREERLD